MAQGLSFFNYQKLNAGFVPDWCWSEDELDFGIAEPREVFLGPGPRLDCFQERPLTPEEELIAREARELDPDRIELGGGLEFSLRVAAELARLLGYEKPTDQVGLVIGQYLSENGTGKVRGMDGVVKFLTKFFHSPSLWDAAIDFARRMIPHCPEVSQNSRAALIKEARRNKRARELGLVLFGRVFGRWVDNP